MYKSIVVGTDGSDTASQAVEHAVELARSTCATLHIVNAHQTVSMGRAAMGAEMGAPTFDVVEVNKSIAHESESVCKHASHAAERAGVTTELHVVPGDAADAIIAVAQEVDADLIVIGNRGMSGLRRYVLGSVPNKVSHHAPCSLLIVATS
jgi:nucleotide-binding universal stress UspA family protein